MMIAGLAFLAGALIGGSLIYLLRAVKIAALTQQLSSEKNTKEKLQSEFRLAASEALQNANAQFLSSAIKDLHSVKKETDSSVDLKKQEIQSSVNEMKGKLEDYQKIVKKFEEERSSMYAKIEQSLTQVLSAEQSVRMETAALKNVLTSSSGVRGKWGERILLEILEQNNLVRGIHFDTQVTLGSEGENDLRPDFVIHLPGGKRMIIDSKEVAGEYVLAQETENAEAQKQHYDKLVLNIRNNFIKLSRKEYQSLLDPDIPFVVMFIPSEAAIRAAFATDPSIFEEATKKRVILASPMTVVPLIYLVAHSWQQHRLAENAQELGNAVEKLGNYLYTFVEHLQTIRGGIKKTIEGWDKAIGSWQTRVSPQIEKAKTLGGRLKETEELTSIDASPRSLTDETTADTIHREELT